MLMMHCIQCLTVFLLFDNDLKVVYPLNPNKVSIAVRETYADSSALDGWCNSWKMSFSTEISEIPRCKLPKGSVLLQRLPSHVNPYFTNLVLPTRHPNISKHVPIQSDKAGRKKEGFF